MDLTTSGPRPPDGRPRFGGDHLWHVPRTAVRPPRRADGHLATGGRPPGRQQAPAGAARRVPRRLRLPGGHSGCGRRRRGRRPRQRRRRRGGFLR